MSAEERERLKEQYKEHYRILLEQKKKLAAYERKARIMKSLQEIDPSPVLSTFQDALRAVREKVAMAESRLESWMPDQKSEPEVNLYEAEEVVQRQHAKDIIRQIRNEMGVIERDLDDKAAGLTTGKTIASESGSGNPSTERINQTKENRTEPDAPGNTGKDRKADASPKKKKTQPDPARTDTTATKTIGRKKT